MNCPIVSERVTEKPCEIEGEDRRLHCSKQSGYRYLLSQKPSSVPETVSFARDWVWEGISAPNPRFEFYRVPDFIEEPHINIHRKLRPPEKLRCPAGQSSVWRLPAACLAGNVLAWSLAEAIRPLRGVCSGRSHWQDTLCRTVNEAGLTRDSSSSLLDFCRDYPFSTHRGRGWHPETAFNPRQNGPRRSDLLRVVRRGK